MLRRRTTQNALQIMQGRHVREIDVQGRHGDAAFIYRPQIRTFWWVGFLAAKSEPEIFVAARICALVRINDGLIAMALERDRLAP